MSADYETGYCKPPKAHQFTKGKSGNPAGRPPKPKGKTGYDPSSILTKPVTVRSNGKVQEMSALEVGLRKKTEEAAKTTSTRKLLKALKLFEDVGIVVQPSNSKHIPVVRLPRRWDATEYWAMLDKYGPPPWHGPDDGLPMNESKTHPLSEYRKQHGW